VFTKAEKSFHVGPAAYLEVFAGCYLVYIILSLYVNSPIEWIINKLSPGLNVEDLKINEDIGFYQNCLDFVDKRYTYMEEFNMRRFGIKTIHDDDLNRIKGGKQRMQP